MKKKSASIIVAVILCIALMIQVVPMAVYADAGEAFNKNTETSAAIEETLAREEDEKSIAEVVGEDNSKREEDVKYFRMSDGSYQAVTYTKPVHYLNDNNQYVEINNDLVETKVGDKLYYANKDNNVDVLLPETLDNSSFVYISKDNKKVGWKLKTDAQSKAKVTNGSKVLEADNTRKLIKCTDKKEKTEIENKTKQQAKNNKSHVKYENAFKNIDIQYDLIGNTVKESIVLNKKVKQSEFSFDLTCENVNAVLESDGSVTFYDNKTSKVAYTIEAPYMFDSNENYSSDIEVKLKKTDSGYSYTIVPSVEWLSSKNTVYPVTIDPTMVPSYTAKNIKDTTASFSPRANSNYSVLENEKAYLKAGRRGNVELASLMYVNLPSQITGTARIIDATVNLVYYRGSISTCSTDLQLNVYEIPSDWNQTIFSDNSVLYSDSVPSTPLLPQTAMPIDYTVVNDASSSIDGQWISFNITRSAQNWANGATNRGIMIKEASWPSSEKYARFYDSDSSGTTADPVFVFTYRDTAGLEDYWAYSQQSVGDAGTGYVNDFNGNLVFLHNDAETVGELPTVNVSHVNNSNSATVSSRFGNGWRLNVMQQLIPTDSSVFPVNPYVYTDADGTEHYFYNDNGTLKDEDGLGMIITQTSSSDNNLYRKIQLKDKTVLVFDIWGYLRRTIDTNGNTISYNYGPNSNGNYLGNIIDANGNVIYFYYTQNMERLDHITDAATGRTTYYEYDSLGNLTKIRYSDSTESRYAYAGYLLGLITNSAGYSINYDYTNTASIYRVTRINEIGKGVWGKSLKISYNLGNSTRFEDCGIDGNIDATDDNNVTIYQFDEYGQPVTVYDADGNASSYKYNSDIEKQHQLSVTGSTQKSVVNYVSNPGMDGSGESWENYDNISNISYDNLTGYLGNSSMKVVKTQQAGTQGVYQNIYSIKAGTYTISAYVKTNDVIDSGTGTGANINVRQFYNNSFIRQDATQNYLLGTSNSLIDNGWQRIWVTINVATDNTIVQIVGGIFSTTGTAWFDGIQMESGDTANKLNLLTNSSFDTTNSGPFAYWGISNGNVGIAAPENSGRKGGKSAYIPGNASAEYNVYSIANVSGNEGDVFLVSGWAKATSLLKSSSHFRISVAVCYDTGATVWKNFDFNKNITDWQYTSGVITTDDGDDTTNRHYTSIFVYFIYGDQLNPAYFDDVQLIKDDGASYTYDSSGNLVSSKSAANESSYKYNSNSQITNMVSPTGNSFTYSYDTNGNCTNAETNNGIKTGISYDSKGNATSAKTYNSEVSTEISTGQNYYIRQKLSGKYLSVKGSSDTCGSLVEQRAFDGTTAQQWSLVEDGKGYYTIKSTLSNSGRVLDVRGGTNADGTAVWLYDSNSSIAQQYKVKYISDGCYEIISKCSNDTKAVANNSNATSTSADLTIQTISGNNNQLWYFELVEKTNTPTIPTDGKTYAIRGKNSGQYIDVYGLGTTDGTNIIQYFYNGGENQQFNLERDGTTDYYYIVPQHAVGMVLSKNTATTLNGYPTVCIKTKNTSDDNQKFRIEPNGNSFSISCKSNGYYLELCDSSYSPGAQFIVTPNQTTQPNKMFTFEEFLKETASTFYNSSGTKVEATIDQLGTSTRYSYDLNGRLVSGVTTGGGEDAKTTNYTYYSDDSLKTVSSGNSSVSYTYENKRLSTITHNGFSYIFSYDNFGNTTSTTVGSQNLSTNAYNRVGLLDSTTYGNGSTIKYSYNTKYQVESKSYNGGTTAAITYKYDSIGNLIESNDLTVGVIYYYNYDLLNRVTSVRASDGTQYHVAYDSKNRTSVTISKVAGTTTKNEYVYDSTSKVSSIKLNGTQSIDYNYDSLLRLKEKKLSMANNYTTEYSYAQSLNTSDVGYTAAKATGRVVSGDFNGDGKDDVAMLYANSDGNCNIYTFISTGSGFGWQSWYSGSYVAAGATRKMVAGDFNGDGKDDIVIMYDCGNSETAAQVFLSTGSSFGKQTWWDSGIGGFDANKITGRVVAGDFNGDGKDDIGVLYAHSSSYSEVYTFIACNGYFSWQSWYAGTYAAAGATDKIASGDFNADGKDDIVIMYDCGNSETATQIFMSTGSSFGKQTWWDSGVGGFDANKITGRVVAGDFNGDGKDDVGVLYAHSSSYSEVYTFISTGSGLSWQSWYANGYSSANVTNRMVAGDFNGDGKDDLCGLYKSADNVSQLNTWISTGSKLTSYANWWQVITSTKNTTSLVGSVKNGNNTLSYTYDQFGNIISISKNGSLQESYEYDKLNQLTKVTNSTGVYVYSYDNGGNITSVILNGSAIKSYGYSDSNWKDKLTSFNGDTITYDAIGNPLQYRSGYNFTWQNGRQLAAVTNGSNSYFYTYNADGIRTSKTVNGVTTNYYVMDGVLLGEKTGNNTIIYLYDESGNKYGIIYNGTYYYFIFNAQGDVIGIVDSSGDTVVEYTYDAWGNALTTTGRLAATIGTANPIRYRGYYYDAETGLFYVGSRYYDPEIGRFINADTTDILGLPYHNMSQYNLFAYCNNNPVNDFDDDGQLSFLAKIAIGVAAVAVGAAVVALTGGTAAAFVPALVAGVKAAAISGAIGATVGAGTSAVSHRVSTGSWSGSGKAALGGAVDGFASGFMTGGIMAGGSQVVSSGFKVAAKMSVNAGKPVSSGIKLSKNVKILSPDKLYHKTNGGTLLKIGKTFRIDINSSTMLHTHFPGPFASTHFPIGIIGSGLYGGIKR